MFFPNKMNINTWKTAVLVIVIMIFLYFFIHEVFGVYVETVKRNLVE